MKRNKEFNNRICIRINDSDLLKINHILYEVKNQTITKLLRNIISKEINKVYYSECMKDNEVSA